jgi:hydroxymethylbilane synthase
MPLAAFAQWRDDTLVLRAALGHPERTDAPLLHSTVEAAVQNAAEARHLGERAAAMLREQGAAGYLAS